MKALAIKMSCKERGDFTPGSSVSHPQEKPPVLPVRMAWAKARGSTDELRRYIWNMENKGGEGSKTALLRTYLIPYSHTNPVKTSTPNLQSDLTLLTPSSISAAPKQPI